MQVCLRSGSLCWALMFLSVPMSAVHPWPQLCTIALLRLSSNLQLLFMFMCVTFTFELFVQCVACIFFFCCVILVNLIGPALCMSPLYWCSGDIAHAHYDPFGLCSSGRYPALLVIFQCFSLLMLPFIVCPNPYSLFLLFLVLHLLSFCFNDLCTSPCVWWYWYVLICVIFPYAIRCSTSPILFILIRPSWRESVLPVAYVSTNVWVVIWYHLCTLGVWFDCALNVCIGSAL